MTTGPKIIEDLEMECRVISQGSRGLIGLVEI